MATKEAQKKRAPRPEPIIRVMFDIIIDRVAAIKSESKVEKNGVSLSLGLAGSGRASLVYSGDFGDQNLELGYMKSIKVNFRTSNIEYLQKFIYQIQDCEIVAEGNLLFGEKSLLRLRGYQNLNNTSLRNLTGAKDKSIEITFDDKNEISCGQAKE